MSNDFQNAALALVHDAGFPLRSVPIVMRLLKAEQKIVELEKRIIAFESRKGEEKV